MGYVFDPLIVLGMATVLIPNLASLSLFAIKWIMKIISLSLSFLVDPTPFLPFVSLMLIFKTTLCAANYILDNLRLETSFLI